VNARGTVDTLNVPSGEYVVFRMKMADFTGRSVYHCHIAFHEDMGMMGEIEISDPVAPPVDPTSTTSTVPNPTPTDDPARPVVVNPTFTG
jgi:hypothetical protein